MSSEWIIGALAFVTIGLVIAIAIYHFGTFLNTPVIGVPLPMCFRMASQQQRVSEQAPAGSYHDRPLKERLDDSVAPAHPADPEVIKTGRYL